MGVMELGFFWGVTNEPENKQHKSKLINIIFILRLNFFMICSIHEKYLTFYLHWNSDSSKGFLLNPQILSLISNFTDIPYIKCSNIDDL